MAEGDKYFNCDTNALTLDQVLRSMVKENSNGKPQWRSFSSCYSPVFTPVTEDSARISNQSYSYSGTVRTVGSGKTYATLTAAYAACVNGDIIEVYGTINLNSEASGYWLINTAKNVLVRGSTSVSTDTVLDQSAAALFCVRVRVNSGIVFKNLTIQTNQNISVVHCDGDEANRNIIYDNVRFIQNGSGASSFLTSISNAITSTTTRWFEYKDCYFKKNGVDTNVGIFISDNSSNSTHLYTGCTFDVATNPGFRCSDVMIGSLAMYDCIFNQGISQVAVHVGQNTLIPTSTVGLFDFRGNTISFLTGTYNHGLLVGRGTNIVKCYNNQVEMDSVNNDTAIGIVIKSTSSVVGNAIYKGNFCISPRPFYIKGGSKAIVEYNVFESNNSNWNSFDFSNHKSGGDEMLSQNNRIKYNKFISLNYGIYVYNTGCAQSDNDSIRTCDINYNDYYFVTNYLMDVQNLSDVTWANRATYWGNNNDQNSTLISCVE